MTQRLSQDKAFFFCFVICLFFISLPVKNSAYFVPPIYLFLQFWFGNQRMALRTILIAIGAIIVSIVAVSWDHLSGRDVNPPGILFGLLTYFPIFMILAENFERPISDTVYRSMHRTISWYLIAQSIIGLAQFAISRNPDAVCGTFGLFDFLNGGITIAQVYFTFNLFVFILFLAIGPQTLLSQIAIGSALFTCVLAQSGHQTIFFVVAVAVAGITRPGRPFVVVKSSLAVVMTLGLLMLVYPNTQQNALGWLEKTVMDEHSPKRLAVNGSVEALSEPKNLLIGTGIGQYCSRAALFSSDDYLRTKLPGALSGKSHYYKRHLQHANEVFEETGEESALSKPYFSLLSVLTEFGLGVGVLLFLVLLIHLRRNFYLSKSPDKSCARFGLVANIGLTFFVLCCAVENYAEFPQAVFMPALMYIFAGSRFAPFLEKQTARELRSDPAAALHAGVTC
jgi:hypothetical protein